MENGQLICCSDIGDIFVMENLQTVQIIDFDELVQPGSEINNRLKF